MRELYFLLPGTRTPFGGGGLWAEMKTYELVSRLRPARIVTYRQREADRDFLDDVILKIDRDNSIFVVSWGFDVPELVKKLRGFHIIYHAHSTGYGFRLPPNIPIISVSRNTMAYWGEKSPNSPLYYLPNHLGTEFGVRNTERDIDVLVQGRKSSGYLLNQLVPALRSRCRVKVLDSYVEDLAGLFNRSKIYLYDSAEYWAVSGLTEGFGLPPLEALACGCTVFSSLNSALSDYLDPGFNCYQIGVYSLKYDVDRILQTIAHPVPALDDNFFVPYSADRLLPRLEVILKEIDYFFDNLSVYNPDIAGLGKDRVFKLWLGRTISKIKKKLFKAK